MDKQDIIISLLKEIDKNIDNANNSGGINANLKELIVTANGEYLPSNYNADGFSKVTANVVPTNKVVLPNEIKITTSHIINGYWAGELVDTRRITTMNGMFALCASLQSLDVSNWDVNSVTNMDYMFRNCQKLQSLDVSNWDVSNVRSATIMFGSCNKLRSLIDNLTIDDVLENNIGALNGLKVALLLVDTILDRASLRAVINGLADLTGQTSQTLSIGETLIDKITEEDIAIATAKNWTIA